MDSLVEETDSCISIVLCIGILNTWRRVGKQGFHPVYVGSDDSQMGSVIMEMAVNEDHNFKSGIRLERKHTRTFQSFCGWVCIRIPRPGGGLASKDSIRGLRCFQDGECNRDGS